MALSLTRWVVAAVVGAASIFTLTIPKERNFAGHNVPEPNQERAAASRAADQLRVLQLRDSILALPASKASQVAAANLFIEPTLPASYHIEAVVRDARLEEFAPGTTSAPLTIAFVSDTATLVEGVVRNVARVSVDYILPTPTAPSCMTIVRFGRDLTGNENELTRVKRRLRGICAHFAKLGNPGRPVREWLQRTQFLFAEMGRETYGTRMTREEISYYANVGPVARGCATGRKGLCARGMLGETEVDREDYSYERLTVWGGVVSGMYGGSGPLGPMSGRLLGDLTATYGQRAMSAMWTSDAPIAESFRKATGVELDDAVQQWMDRQYGHGTIGYDYRSRSVDRVFQAPGVTTKSKVFSGVVLLLGLAVGATVAARRQFA